MELTSPQRVGQGLEILRDGIRPKCEEIWREIYGDEWLQEVNKSLDEPLPDPKPTDIYFLLKAMKATWKEDFSSNFAPDARSLVFELASVRNTWAHQRGISSQDALRALDSMERLLGKFGDVEHRQKINQLHEDLMRRQVKSRDIAESRKTLHQPAETRPEAAVSTAASSAPEAPAAEVPPEVGEPTPRSSSALEAPAAEVPPEVGEPTTPRSSSTPEAPAAEVPPEVGEPTTPRSSSTPEDPVAETGPEADMSASGSSPTVDDQAAEVRPLVAPTVDDQASGARPAVASTPSLRLSPAAAHMFEECPRRWRFRYVDQLPDPPDEAALVRNFVRRVLELLMQRSAGERTTDTAREIAGDEWPEVRADDDYLALGLDEAQDRGFKRKAWEAIEDLWRLEDPKRVEVLDTRHEIETELGGVPFRGVIDRLDEESDGTVVVDYELEVPQRGYRPSHARVLLYAAAVTEHSGNRPAGARVLQLVPKGKPEMRRIDITPTAIDAAVHKLARTWQSINAARETGEFRPRPGGRCHGCAYLDRCPEGNAYVAKRPRRR